MGFLSRWKEKKKQKLAEQQELAEQRQRQIRVWQTEDLSQYAAKIDGLILKKNEYGYLAIPELITWNEDRTRTKRVNYAGPTASIHIMKGLNYRVGSVSVNTEKTTKIVPIFTGAVFLTNKRIFLVNHQGSKAINLSGIVQIIPYTDGVALFRESGKRILLTGFSDAERFNIYLQRILNNDYGLIAEEKSQNKTTTQMSQESNASEIQKKEISNDDPRLQFSESFIVAKDTAIKRAEELCKEDKLYANNNTDLDPEMAVIAYVLPIYHYADLLYKKGEWIQAEDQWLSILPKMPNHVGEKLAIMYRKEKRYRNEVEVINAAIKYTEHAVPIYAHSDSLMMRKTKAQSLLSAKLDEDKSIVTKF